MDPADRRPRRHGGRDGRDRVVAAPRRGARGDARGARLRAARAPGGALRRRRLRELRAPAAVDRGGRVVAHGAVRPGRDPRPARGARAPLPVDRPRRPRSTSATGSSRPRATRDYALGLVVERCRTREQQERAVAALRFKTEMLWAQLEAIERGDTQPRGRAREPAPARRRRPAAVRRRARGAPAAHPGGRRAPERDGGAGARAVRRRALASRRSPPRSRSATPAPTSPTTCASCSAGWPSRDWWSMPAPRPYTLVAELTYQCPLHCPYCSNPVDIGGDRWRARARDRALDPRLPRGAGARRPAARPDRRRADAAPRPRRARRRRRARPACTRRSSPPARASRASAPSS